MIKNKKSTQYKFLFTVFGTSIGTLFGVILKNIGIMVIMIIILANLGFFIGVIVDNKNRRN